MSVRDVEQGDTLQRRPVGQIERHTVAHDVNIFVQVLARRRERLGRGEFKVPQFVLHPTVEFVGILLSLRVEFHANRRILFIFKYKQSNYLLNSE